jgi:hypothetical protein
VTYLKFETKEALILALPVTYIQLYIIAPTIPIKTVIIKKHKKSMIFLLFFLRTSFISFLALIIAINRLNGPYLFFLNILLF